MITILDSIMGSGKTSLIIEHINNTYRDYLGQCVDDPSILAPKFLYVTPLLSEVDRINGKPPRSHVDFERRASSGLSYDGGCSGGLLWHRVFALAQSLPFPWQHFMEA
jgi:hypothetical protein